jgi:hypothetical protein
MPCASRFLAPLALLALIVAPGCTALQQLAALRTVTFAFAGVSDVRIAGIRIGAGSSYASLGVADVARLGAAVIAKDVPLELIAHVSASNPPENTVTARMVDLGWTLFIDNRQALVGQLGGAIAIEPGKTADVPLTVRLDLLQLGSGGARDLFDLALAIAGVGSLQKDLRFELVPTIETSIGPIRYPAPVVVSRAATSH